MCLLLPSSPGFLSRHMALEERTTVYTYVLSLYELRCRKGFSFHSSKFPKGAGRGGGKWAKSPSLRDGTRFSPDFPCWPLQAQKRRVAQAAEHDHCGRRTMCPLVSSSLSTGSCFFASSGYYSFVTLLWTTRRALIPSYFSPMSLFSLQS